MRKALSLASTVQSSLNDLNCSDDYDHHQQPNDELPPENTENMAALTLSDLSGIALGLEQQSVTRSSFDASSAQSIPSYAQLTNSGIQNHLASSSSSTPDISAQVLSAHIHRYTMEELKSVPLLPMRMDDEFYHHVCHILSQTLRCGSDHGNIMVAGLTVAVLFRLQYPGKQDELKYLIINRISRWTGLTRLNASKIAYLSQKIFQNRSNPFYIAALGDWSKNLDGKNSFLAEATKMTLWWKSSFPKKFSFYQLQLKAAEIEKEMRSSDSGAPQNLHVSQSSVKSTISDFIETEYQNLLSRYDPTQTIPASNSTVQSSTNLFTDSTSNSTAQLMETERPRLSDVDVSVPSMMASIDDTSSVNDVDSTSVSMDSLHQQMSLPSLRAMKHKMLPSVRSQEISKLKSRIQAKASSLSQPAIASNIVQHPLALQMQTAIPDNMIQHFSATGYLPPNPIREPEPRAKQIVPSTKVAAFQKSPNDVSPYPKPPIAVLPKKAPSGPESYMSLVGQTVPALKQSLVSKFTYTGTIPNKILIPSAAQKPEFTTRYVTMSPMQPAHISQGNATRKETATVLPSPIQSAVPKKSDPMDTDICMPSKALSIDQLLND